MASWLEKQLSSANKHMGISSAYLKKVSLQILGTSQLISLPAQQANAHEVTGGKGSGGKNGKPDDFDAMMAAEEFGDRGKRGGVGADQSDVGY